MGPFFICCIYIDVDLYMYLLKVQCVTISRVVWMLEDFEVVMVLEQAHAMMVKSSVYGVFNVSF